VNRLERRRGLSDLIDRSIRVSGDPEVQWVPLVSDENLDILSDRLTPEHGCSTCGSVWVYIDSVGVMNPLATGLYRQNETLAAVLMREPVVAVRLICFMGHTEEYHRRISWSDTFPGAALACALAAYLFTKEKK